MIRLFFILCLVFASCMTNRIEQNHLEKKYSKSSPCATLLILSDSIQINNNFINGNKDSARQKAKTFYEILNRLFRDSKLEPSWNCTFDLCSYNSLSLNKSIYKIDILRLMRFYKCDDSTRLQLLTTGSFSKQDLQIIERKYKYSIPIDTMILYGK